MKYTDDQYVAYEGTRCKNCGESFCLEGDAIEVDAGFARQPIVCEQCSASWIDVYKLVAVEDFEAPRED